MAGTNANNYENQLLFVKSLLPPETQKHLAQNDVYEIAISQNGHGGYGKIEAQILHAFTAIKQPRKILQVGCGVSTAICLNAIGSHFNSHVTCIEPYPNSYLRRMHDDGKIKLIEKQVQEVSVEITNDLDDGDFLFIDSSHTLGPAGEVTRLILEWLPWLKMGVFVHFHDIWFPYDYAKSILDEPMFFWHETALLHAFMAFNQTFKIEASLSLLHYKRQEDLKELFPKYNPGMHEHGLQIKGGDYPSSVYLRRIK